MPVQILWTFEGQPPEPNWAKTGKNTGFWPGCTKKPENPKMGVWQPFFRGGKKFQFHLHYLSFHLLKSLWYKFQEFVTIPLRLSYAQLTKNVKKHPKLGHSYT